MGADKKSETKVQTIFVLKSALKMAVNHLRIVGTRGLSTSTGRLQLVQPPIQVFGTEGRYATALYSAATKKKALDTVEKDLKMEDLTWQNQLLLLLVPLWLHIGVKLS